MAVTIKGFASDWSVPAPAQTVLNTLYDKVDPQGRAPVRKGELTLNVKDHGVVGDGVTDDTAAIQAILNGSAPDIYFPEGTYKVSLSNATNGTGFALTTFNKNRTIRGAGYRKTKLVLTDGEGILAISRATLAGFDIDGGFVPSTTRLATLSSLVQANEDTVVSDCYIHNASGSCLVGTGERVRYERNRLEKFGDHAIYFLGELAETAPYAPTGTGARDVKITGNTMIDDPTYHNNTTYGSQRFALKFRNNVSDVVVDGNYIDGDITISGDTRRVEANPRKITISNNIIRAPYGGVYMETLVHPNAGQTNIWIDDILIANNIITGRTTTGGTGIILRRSRATITGNVIERIDAAIGEGGDGDTGPQTITNNVIRNVRVGIYTPGTGSTVDGNLLADVAVALHLTFHAHIKRNTFRGCTTRAINVSNGYHATNRTLIESNTFMDNTLALDVQSFARSSALIRNTFINNTTSATIRDGASFNTQFVSEGNRVLSGAALPAAGSTETTPLVMSAPVAKVPSLPAASATYRGQMVRVEDATNGDQAYICRMIAGGTYEWKALLV